ncbi:MAG: peptide-methionine (R)-S-oxide reductase [Pseudomonadota bacterium]
MTPTGIPRRTFLGSVAAGAVLPGTLSAEQSASDTYAFEIVKTDEEWREKLSDEAFFLLRQGGTEPPKSHPYWEQTADGIYCCGACSLPLYDSYWKTVLPQGWVFFRHSFPMATMTDIDRLTYGDVARSGESVSTMAANAGMQEELTEEEIRALDTLAGVEAICRRCGSHLGHIVTINNTVLHCINGGCLDFQPAAT